MIFPTIAPLLASLALATPNTVQDLHNYLRSVPLVFVAFTSRTLDSVQSFNNIFTQTSINTSTLYLTVNCDIDVDLCHDYDINTYPTIRLFENDPKTDDTVSRMTRYRGPRTKRAFQSFIKKRELPVLSHISSNEIETFQKSDDIVIIASLHPNQESLLTTFSIIAARHHLRYIFAYTTIDAQTSVPTITCYKNTDNDHRTLTGAFTEADLESFLATSTPSVIKTFREKDLETFMQRDKLTCYIFLALDDDDLIATTLRRGITPLAKKYEKYITFALAALPKHAEMAGNFGAQINTQAEDAKGRGAPVLLVHAPMNDNVFYFQQGKKVSADAVEDMLTRILQGKAQNGQVLGQDAEDWEDVAGEEVMHDEL
ncbi:hypothetical protein FB567DRAFT_510344 [Paraphoma chrysanthemicola]|uniref:Thioredoxin domain-containing protein n=1 Tax=Paraphoma chrysanthemicola TaxID=798071 RepID=A0A8K0RIK1_9PLEO|nr:hypothetical protein FB567DRAFT_510344 [Paraphoma chrysanthemicola]